MTEEQFRRSMAFSGIVQLANSGHDVTIRRNSLGEYVATWVKPGDPLSIRKVVRGETLEDVFFRRVGDA